MSGIIERVTPGQMEDPARLKMVQARLELLTWFPEVANFGRDLGFEMGAERAFGKAFCERRKVTSRSGCG